MTVEAGVTAVPMSAFYDGDGPTNFVRFCFSKRDAVLDEATRRIRCGLPGAFAPAHERPRRDRGCPWWYRREPPSRRHCDRGRGGRPRVAIGDVDQAVFPRSAVKALQALPLVESGAADRYGFGNAELALACASHSGEPRHVATAMRMLGAAGRGEADLACGVSWPANREAANALARAGVEPSALHDNCSGKHAGFICLACHMGVDPANYVRPDQPVQREVTATLAALTEPNSATTIAVSTAARSRPMRSLWTSSRSPSRGSSPARACPRPAPRQRRG